MLYLAAHLKVMQTSSLFHLLKLNGVILDLLGGAAVFALILSFVGKFSALISTIPSPVMGGVSILLFGIIASSGLRMLVDEKVDLSINRNLVISSVIIVLGVGGAMLKFESINFELPAMALAAISGVLLNAFLPKEDKK